MRLEQETEAPNERKQWAVCERPDAASGPSGERETRRAFHPPAGMVSLVAVPAVIVKLVLTALVSPLEAAVRVSVPGLWMLQPV